MEITMENPDVYFANEAIKEAYQSLNEGGIPIGSVLVINGRIAGRGHNQSIQKKTSILHAETDALENAKRLSQEDYSKATLYTTLSPCFLCTGAILLYKIPRVVLCDNENFMGEEQLLKAKGVEVVNLQLKECVQLMKEFINDNQIYGMK